MTVDEFIESKVLPEFRPIVATIRRLVGECAPDAQEAFGYGMPVFKRNKTFAWISAAKKDIKFGFSRGTQMEDKYALLQGAAKGARHVKMRNLSEVNEPALKYYIKQAVNLDDR
jgi:hypothetical protein